MLEPYIEMITKLRTEEKKKKKKRKNWKRFFKIMNNIVFGKTMENVRKHRDIELVISNYHTTKYFSENILSIEMKKQK